MADFASRPGVLPPAANKEEWDAYWESYAAAGRRASAPEPVAETQPAKRSAAASAAGHGIGLGSALAVVLSFQLNHSVLWATVHGICSWLYVGYRVWEGNY